MPPRYFSPRLRTYDYIGPLAAHLVFVTRGRSPIFAVDENATVCLNALADATQAFTATIHAYCLMPDPTHVLVEVGEGVRLTEFVRRFKQLSSYRLKQRTGAEAWQTSYYDHILRSDEAILDVARYIWENPVTDGLVVEYSDYKWSGPQETMTALQPDAQT